MVYMIFASIFCAIQAIKQPGPANDMILFSVIITYGCKNVLSGQASFIRPSMLIIDSICSKQHFSFRSMAYDHQFYPVFVAVPKLHQHTKHVSIHSPSRTRDQ